MPYITLSTTPRGYQITLEDILAGVTIPRPAPARGCEGDTRTIYKKEISSSILREYNIPYMLNELVLFNKEHKDLIEKKNKRTLYKSFNIPKSSGGLRRIDAPIEPLCKALRELKTLFENKLFASHHTSAFAYVKGRSIINALKKHQYNKSRWYLKIDFHDFFGTSTFDFVMRQLEWIFPFSEIIKLDGGSEELRRALSLAFLDGGLPQGTPISPLITNLIMTPIDHHLSKMAREHTPHLIYTRYADDLLFSSDISFQWNEVQKEITKILQNFTAPYTINEKKTRYGSSSGSNWNLGLMVNKDNQITIGHQKKKLFKAILFSLHKDIDKGVQWSKEDLQVLQGQMSYYLMVEKDNINKIIEAYDTKFNRHIIPSIKSMLKSAA
jgi:hypothetical protein